MNPEDRTVVQLLKALQVDVPFGIETGRVSASTDTNPQILAAEPDALSRDQKYFAQSGTVQLRITRHQMEALRRKGAPGGDVEVMRSFKNDQERHLLANTAPAASAGSISAAPRVKASASAAKTTVWCSI